MATKLTNVQKASIQEQLAEGKGISDIAKDLTVPLSAVKDYLVKLFESLAKVNEITKNSAKEANAKKNIKNVMITKTNNNRKGVAIMTPAGSERVDEANKREREKRELKGDGGFAFRERYTDCLHKINEDE